jgi:hypothetical protein
MEREESIKDATSKETVKDLEENEASNEDSDESNMPSPDGAFDEDDELKDADAV